MIEFNLNRTRIGAITIAAAAVNDVVGWLLLTVVTAITLGHSSVFNFSARILGIGAFLGLSWWIARPALRWLINRLGAGDQHLPSDLLAIMLLVIFSAAVLTEQLGVFTVFGAFMVGTLLHDQKDFIAAWRRHVGKFVLVFFLPVFFTYTGMRIRISGLSAIEMWFWCLLFAFAAMLSKFGACYWAAKRVGINTYEAMGIAIMMNTRGLMELVVLNIGADLGILPPTVFTMLVIMAITSTIITTPVLHAISLRYPSILPIRRAMNY
jgi:Kef-type K+ transport systems, membrane components